MLGLDDEQLLPGRVKEEEGAAQCVFVCLCVDAWIRAGEHYGMEMCRRRRRRDEKSSVQLSTVDLQTSCLGLQGSRPEGESADRERLERLLASGIQSNLMISQRYPLVLQ